MGAMPTRRVNYQIFRHRDSSRESRKYADVNTTKIAVWVHAGKQTRSRLPLCKEQFWILPLGKSQSMIRSSLTKVAKRQLIQLYLICHRVQLWLSGLGLMATTSHLKANKIAYKTASVPMG